VVAQALPQQEEYLKRNNSNSTTNCEFKLNKQTVNNNNQSAQVFWKQTRWNLSKCQKSRNIFQELLNILKILLWIIIT
jgi:hypothetical protein